jgi:CheY-like chemotaxis protein/HPt (histidine-containing phosphotransfer) domain-containing protein
MDSLRRSFLIDGRREVRRMLEFVGSQIDPVAARRQCHQWIGSAGALGYLELAEKARAAEKVLSQTTWSRNELRESLDNLAHAFAAPREAAETEIPGFICKQLAGQRIALVGLADEQAERACVALEKVGALALLFTGSESPASDPIRNCSVVMVHVREQTCNFPWLRPDCHLLQPLVLIGGREDLFSLPPDVQAKASDLLIDSWQPEEVVIRLSLVLARGGELDTVRAGTAPTKPDVLLVDDDPNVIAVVRSHLESQGMECRHALNGSDALAMVTERCPKAIVLDVNMPGLDGFAVLASIRELGLGAKVILLTARQHERDILRGFELGADDYVVKPFHPLELAARLKRLV